MGGSLTFERVGEVNYKFLLPPTLKVVQDVFRVSQLSNTPYMRHVLDHLEEKLDASVLETRPFSIMDR